MRHRVAGRRLGRDSEHRLAMRRNMVASLFEHETISTTIEKAKEVRGFAEKLITLAKKGTLANRRLVIARLGHDRKIVAEENGEIVKKGTVVGKLFSEIGPRYLERDGGYTRIIKLAMRRLGDNGRLVLLQLVGADEKVGTKKSKTSKPKPVIKAQDKVVEVSEETEVAEEVTEVTDVTEENTEKKEQ